ncbi:MAG: hypothetical protein IPM74_00905 [Crocinitomicaceae bacterium]|nr:hypothetical protein [Crocinitomicaceae bacterium]MBK8924476.1 hypothetical protein [Crocinitomicaceae bacterium]
MKIFLTYDYELFFGNPPGTAEKSILQPTEMLRDIAHRTKVKLGFFIDAGYLVKLNEFAHQFSVVKAERDAVFNQIKNLVADGHACDLHIHPHWEDCTHNGEQWIMKTNRYKLDDFSDFEIEQIFIKYHQALTSITGYSSQVYRAGGWCIQPFSRIKKAFDSAGILIDSTVFPGGKSIVGNYSYDFTNSPKKSSWKFSQDVCVEDKQGNFLELPISSHYYNPLFFWKLFLLGRLDKYNHKPLGDGYPMSTPGLRKKMLTKGMLLSASTDGYFVTRLDQIIQQNTKRNFDEMVVLGHPKACTRYALKKLEEFIERNKNMHQFTTFNELILAS